ncbi:MAG: hypothetical protein LUG61_00280 [Lachnospiraceae bacterium]|nr:hypothetical protein [Lachnospiraceae bacterium]
MSMNETLNEKSYSSDISMDMNREFVWQNFLRIRWENSPVYGAANSGEVVIEPVNFDMLNYLFMRTGTYLILFGGVWSKETQNVIDQVNFYARKYGVERVYLFDFSADGTAEATIKQDITAHEYYVGPGKKEANPFAVYNYLYGEMVTRHLTNLNSWVCKKIGSGEDITYLNLYRDPVTVPNLTEPFLFLYNKDNTVDNADSGIEADTYPIVWAAELEEDKEGQVDKFFSRIGENNCAVTPYSQADYIREAFAQNGRGHSFKTEDAFREDEQINLEAVSFQVYYWLLQQKGTFLFLLAGPWCANSQAAVATVNDYAVANQVRVYMTDSRLDSKHAIDFWQYPRRNELTMTCPPMRKYFVEIWEDDLPGACVVCFTSRRGRSVQPTLSYQDETGQDHTVLRVGIPYCFAYDRDHCDANGAAPVLASFQNEAIELINISDKFVYHDPLYRELKAASYKVFYAYQADLGKKMTDITIDRTAPIVEGEMPKHVETVAYYKAHDWYQEPEDPEAVHLCTI